MLIQECIKNMLKKNVNFGHVCMVSFSIGFLVILLGTSKKK